MYNNVMNMNGNFKPFRVWCQHVLPTIYDDSLSYMELLNKVIDYINQFGGYLDEFSALNAITYEGVWDITKQYKAWSVVSVNSEAGYVSIKPVPAGVQITNTEYWQLIADYTAIIAGLAERVVALEAEDVEIHSDITNITNRVTTLEEGLASANANITIANNTANHAVEIARNSNLVWNDRVLLFLGDSYMTGWHSDGTASPTFVETCCNIIGNNNYYVYAEGGTGFSYARPHHYTEMLANFISEHPTVIPTDVFILGGYNDNTEARNDILTSNDNPYNAKKTCEAIRTSFPNAIIHIGYIGRGANANTARSYIENINKCAITYQIASRTNHCHYIEKSELMLHDYTGLSSDGIHPNQKGHDDLGKYLASSLLFGYYQYEEADTWHRINLDRDLTGTSKTKLAPAFSVVPIFEKLTNEGIVIQARSQLLNFFANPVTGVSLDGNYNKSLCIGRICGTANCKNYIANFGNANQIVIPIQMNTIFGINGTNTVLTNEGNFIIDEDGTVLLQITHIQPDQTYPPDSDAKWILFPAFEFTLPLNCC